MKVLILNGSPRPDGDTACIVQKLKEAFPGNTVFEVLNAFEADIRPCNDCRYCWENEGCCISDQMNVLWKDDYDILVLASPLYMSFLTPPLFSVISRLNAVWSNRFFLKLPDKLKRKKGILILTGGGDGSPGPAISIARTAFHFLNACFDPEIDYICSLHTNRIPVQCDPNVETQINRAVSHVLNDRPD